MELVVSFLATVKNIADGFHKLFAQSPPELTSFKLESPPRNGVLLLCSWPHTPPHLAAFLTTTGSSPELLQFFHY